MKWVDGKYNSSSVLVGKHLLSVCWASSGSGYEVYGPFGKLNKRFDNMDEAQKAAVLAMRRYVANILEQLDKESIQ